MNILPANNALVATGVTNRPNGYRRSLNNGLSAICLSVLLIACGGGSGDPEMPNDDPAGEDPTIPESPQVPVGPEVPVVPEDPTDPDTVVDTSDPNQCNLATQNQWVYDSMRDYYLFYDQVPVVNPQSFDSPEELVRSLRFEERDPFSHIADAASSSLQFDEGREFGLGFSMGIDENGVPRLARVTRESPFGLAGLQRGDVLVSVDGVLWGDITFDEAFFERVFGTPESPGSASWVLRKRDSDQVVNFEITADEYSINTVLQGQVLSNTELNGVVYDGTIGYVAFSRFLNTSRVELNAVFDDFRDAGISDLVLDLRYNRGGRIAIAELLASLVGGNSLARQPMLEYRFNDKYTQNNFGLFFLDNVGDLGLSRVVILTGGNTASSSEIVIGGLQPYLEVVTMGARTSGKPYVQIPRDRCGKRLNAIEAEGFNDAGESVFGGIPASCFAADDLTRDFGAGSDGRSEGMLDAALQYLVAGVCRTPAVINAEQRSTDGRQLWQGIFEPGGAVR